MSAKAFRTILFVVVMLQFLATAIVTLLGVTGIYPIDQRDLQPLVIALLVETAGAVLAVFKSGQIFADPPAAVVRLTVSEPIGNVSDRQLAMRGAWTGTARQEVGPGGRAFDAEVRMMFDVERDAVSGRFEYRFTHPLTDKPIVLEFGLKGSFLYERFVRLEYANIHRKYIQFGSVIFELDPSAEKMHGRFLGYGVETKNMVYGSMSMEKID